MHATPFRFFIGGKENENPSLFGGFYFFPLNVPRGMNIFGEHCKILIPPKQSLTSSEL